MTAFLETLKEKIYSEIDGFVSAAHTVRATPCPRTHTHSYLYSHTHTFGTQRAALPPHQVLKEQFKLDLKGQTDLQSFESLLELSRHNLSAADALWIQNVISDLRCVRVIARAYGHLCVNVCVRSPSTHVQLLGEDARAGESVRSAADARVRVCQGPAHRTSSSSQLLLLLLNVSCNHTHSHANTNTRCRCR